MSKVVSVCILLSLALSSGFGQGLPRTRQASEPLEQYGDPPDFLRRNGVSPRMISQFAAFTSYQVNVNANGLNITGDAANEPSICADPTNGNKMAIGWRQFNSVSSNFRQAGWGYSTNGGTTWTFPGVLENNVFRSDPVLSSNDVGSFFYLSLMGSFFDDMWRSLNGGQSWLNIGPAKGGDKQWFTIDKTNSSGHGFQYQLWSTDGNNFNGRQFTRSTDGGATWLDPINIPNSPAWGTLDVDTSGNLFLVGVNFDTGQVWCERSTNAKNGAVTPSFDQSTAINLGGDIDLNEPINPVGLVGQLFLAIDRSEASTKNNIYVLASVLPTGATSGSDVMFVRSTNGGQAFTGAKRINDDPINHSKWHWLGTLAVAPNGRLDCVWLDTRNAVNNTDSQLFYSYSFDGGSNWSPNAAVSNSFNPFLGYPNQQKMGDYITIVSDNGGGNVAYCATFNGEQDIYYVRVFPSVPVPQSAVSRKSHGSAGTFDIALPFSGSPGVECRLGSGPNSDQHQIVVTFANSITDTGITVSSSDGLATATQSVVGGTVTINLANVRNAQTLTVTLANVNDGTRFGNVPIPITVLLGDTTGNGSVNATDISQTKTKSGQSTDATNFRSDTNVSGSINASDISLVKSNSGIAVGPTQEQTSTSNR
jgi:hypothetical protein